MLIRSRRGALLAFGLLPCLATPADSARAAGFSIFEQGARGMGFAGAYAALADDPSAIFHNVGGVGFLTGQRVYLGGTLVSPSFDFTGDDPFPGAGVIESSASTLIPLPALYYTRQFSENVVFGLGVFSPFGLQTEWQDPDSYSGRFVSQRADLKALAVNPVVAFKLADRFAVGVGFDFRLAKVQLDRHVPLVNPFLQRVSDIAAVDLESNWGHGFGFNLGLLAKPSSNAAIGLAYRHHVHVDFTGSAIFNQIPTGSSQVDALVSATLPNGRTALTSGLAFPGIFSGGIAYATESWTFSGEADWFQWSKFDQLELTFPERPDLSQVILEAYKNSWQFRFGVERRLGRSFALRGGYFYDMTPSPPESVTPLLPDASRNGFAAGGSWTSGRLRVDLGSWYLKGKDRSTEGVNRDNYNGTYKPRAVTFGASFGYSF